MSNQLPPSKFGAGTTYGESGKAHSLPKTTPSPPPAPPPSPAYPSTSDPYASKANYAAPPAPDPYAAPSYAPAPDPYAQQYAPAPAGYPAAARTTNPGAGTAITAAILGLAGAVWYVVDTVRTWDGIQAVFGSLDGLSQLGLPAESLAWAYGSVAAIIAQFIVIVLLFVGAILLFNRSPGGRVSVVLGSILVIAANVYFAVYAFRITDWGKNFGGDLADDILLNTALPAVLALVVLVLASSASTKAWCGSTSSGTY